MKILQRIKDWRHELRLDRKVGQFLSAVKQGDIPRAYRIWDEVEQLQASRSSDQIARMEKGMGVRRGQ